MSKTSETIIFFGSGPVAAQALKLLANSFEIEAVVTKPQPEQHKYKFPVIEVSEQLGLKLSYASNKQELSELFSSNPFKSKLGVVIDFGIIISKDVIDYFLFGIINSHFSLLPKWRGADPISFAILGGDNKTGVSLMLINEALDEGELLKQSEIKLDSTINAIELTETLIKLSNDMLDEIIPKYVSGLIKPYPQQGEPTYSRKLSKNDAKLDFNKPAAQLEREVRAFIEWPRSYTVIKDQRVVITKAHEKIGSGNIGQLYLSKDEIGYYTKDNIIVFDKLIPEGKKEIDSAAYLNGYILS